MTLSVESKAVQQLGPLFRNTLAAADTTTETTSETTDSNFESTLRALLSPDSSNQVNEEELFAGIIQERLDSTKGTGAAEDFAFQFAQHKDELARPDGLTSVEKAANRALKDMVTAGHITSEEATEIRTTAFQAAQLDSNTSALYDGRGGPGDPTIAMAELETALQRASAAMAALESGAAPEAVVPTSEETSATTTDSTSELGDTTSVLSSEEGFLFKPESESEGKLVILLPPVLTGKIDSVVLRDENGDVLEEGRSAGVANGNREHFRFNRAGQDYPANLTVEVQLSSGDTKTYQIEDPSQRYE
ncbi:MAG: hypothetical protein KDD60_04100 [Bdellovibrionales bacterium]|nr:hypothetical protein [Bdellovibrionales bacterium]